MSSYTIPTIKFYLSSISHNLVNRLGKVLNVVIVETSHADTAVLGHVDVEFFSKLKHLLLAQPSKAEHTDLVGNVVPGTGGLEFLKLAAESITHADDTARHGAQVLLPLSEEVAVVEDCADDAGTVQRRIGDLGSLEDSQLRANAGNCVGSLRSGRGNGVEAAGTLSVKTEILGETLGNNELEALVNKVSDSPSILDEITGGKALVSSIEEGEVVLLLHDRSDLGPLILGRVDTSRVVCTCVKDEDRALGSGLQSLLETFKIKALGLLVEVRVCVDRKTDILEDLVVVRPGGI
jgi:hypothetical protein